MHSEIDIQVNGYSMALPPDFSLDVTEENPLFHDVEMHSDPVQVPMEGNRHVFQNVDDPQSHQRPVDLEHLPSKISVSGLPLRSGTVAIQEDEELEESFSFNIDERQQSFKSLIGDLKCQDIPLYNNEQIPVGEKICDVHVTVNYEEYVTIKEKGFGDRIKSQQTLSDSGDFDPQALGFSCPGILDPNGNGRYINGKLVSNSKVYPEDIIVNIPKLNPSYINITEGYSSNNGVPNGKRYCNARVCYAHHGLDSSKKVDDVYENGILKTKGTIGETTDDIMSVGEQYSVNEDYGPYWVLDANRQQSGICFYVLYFLDCLFNYLGVTFDNSELMKIEDLKRLCFFTTKHKYVTDIANASSALNNIEEINNWLEARGCGGRIEVNDTEETSLNEIWATVWGKSYHFAVGQTTYIDGPIPMSVETEAITAKGVINSFTATAKVATMYATNENFPEESVQTVLDSLENSFGIRFDYDYQANKVTAYLYREVFRATDDIVTLPVQVLTANKLSEKITGVRMKYSAESDGKEQMENIRRAKRDYDTDFDYIDYREGRTKVSEGYAAIASDLRAENVTCYIDKNTANAYRFKISKDVESANIAYHRLFEVGQFHGIEVGDCSPVNEDYVKELVSDFQPMSFNDVNAYAEKLGSTQPILAAFVDEDMEHEFVTQKINHTIASANVDMYATEVLNLIESYDPSQTDDGNSPLQSVDWGLAIAIMRGGGSDAEIQNYDRGYDGFDNSKWKTIAGKYAMSSDTMDQFGNKFDYNGKEEGDGGGERFSLKIRSWKPFLYYESGGKTHVTSDLSLLGKPVEGVSGKTWQMPCNSDPSIALRGLADVFMAEYIWFLLNRRKLRIHCLAEPAALLDIPNHWRSRFRIGEYLGYIDKLHYSISAETGISEVTIDLYAV